MNTLNRSIIDYLFKYTDVKLLKKDKYKLRIFLETFEELKDNCSVINSLSNCNSSEFKKNVKKHRLSRHHCILCDNIFTSKNKENIPAFFKLFECKKECKSHCGKTCKCKNTKRGDYSFDKINTFFNLDNFIFDLLNFINSSYKEIYDILKENKMTKLEFKNLLNNCNLVQDLLYTLYCKADVNNSYLSCSDLRERCDDKCFICNIIFKAIRTVNDISRFFKLFLDNVKKSNELTNESKQTNDVYDKFRNKHISETKNYFVYDEEYLANEYINKKLTNREVFTLFVSNKNSKINNQWILLFKDRTLFEKLRDIGVFKLLIGVIRYFMLPIVHCNNNPTKYLTYKELCELDKTEWKYYCRKHVDSFFKVKKLYECLVELSDVDKEYYTNNYNSIKNNEYIDILKYPIINEENIIEKFLIVHLKIIEDCKRLINILYNIDEIKFKNLYKYLTPFRMGVLNDIFGNIIMSWTYINAYKKIIFEKVNYRYDYDSEYNMNHLINIDKQIFNILNKNSTTENKCLNKISNLTIQSDVNNLEDLEDGEYSPERVQKEIELLKKSF